jgi:menaquinone-dependent protoporphyrinogen IX oxidase
VTSRDVADATDVDATAFDAVVVGSPVVNRGHLPEVVAFVDADSEALATRPSAFFQLSLAATVPVRWARDGETAFVDALVEQTGWHPDRVGLFADAVAYTEYDPVTRALFRLVAAVTAGDTDTSWDYEYTDLEAVETFATDSPGSWSPRPPAGRRGRGPGCGVPSAGPSPPGTAGSRGRSSPSCTSWRPWGPRTAGSAAPAHRSTPGRPVTRSSSGSVPSAGTDAPSARGLIRENDEPSDHGRRTRAALPAL